MEQLPPYSAVVLAGGRAARLGGQAKPQLEVGGRSMLAAVLDAVADARRRIVVGPAQPTAPGVVVVREEPAGGGPVAALRAGLREVDTEVVAVLAGDLPFLTADVIGDLRREPFPDGVLVVDDTGRDQLLLGLWRTERLRAAVTAPDAPAALHRALRGLDITRHHPSLVPGTPAPWVDCDTPEELTRARQVAGHRPG